ncbi:MAG TPA: hypothetical protein VFR37_12520 [Longimicrobium sp.]|nr:hypothetical protein [Longimicrobium sp.]
MSIEKLSDEVFEALAENEAEMVQGGLVEAVAPGGFTFIGRTQHGDHIDNDYVED